MWQRCELLYICYLLTYLLTYGESTEAGIRNVSQCCSWWTIQLPRVPRSTLATSRRQQTERIDNAYSYGISESPTVELTTELRSQTPTEFTVLSARDSV